MTTKLVAELTVEDLGRRVRVTFAGHEGGSVEGRLLAIHVEARTCTVWEHATPRLLADLPYYADLTVERMNGRVPLRATVEVLT